MANPMPKIVPVVLSPIRERRLLDAALAVRPQSARTVDDIITHDVTLSKLLSSGDTPDGVDPDVQLILSEFAATGRRIDELLGWSTTWRPELALTEHFPTYDGVSRALFTRLRVAGGGAPMFKIVALLVRLMPTSERQRMSTTLEILYRLSQEEGNDGLFTECDLIPRLVKLAFCEIGEIDWRAAAILRHVCGDEENAERMLELGSFGAICRVLRTDIRRQRFVAGRVIYFYQVVALLAMLAKSNLDWKPAIDLNLPRSLLDLTTIYTSDAGLWAASTRALAAILMEASVVDVLEVDASVRGGCLTPFFPLLRSSHGPTREAAAGALANALAMSEVLCDMVATMAPPLGVEGLCSLLSQGGDAPGASALMRAVALATAHPAGAKEAGRWLTMFGRALETPMDEVENWSSDQIYVASALAALTNVARDAPCPVASLLRGKMQSLMVFSLIDYVVEFLRVVMVCDEGIDCFAEVKDVDEIRFILEGDFHLLQTVPKGPGSSGSGSD